MSALDDIFAQFPDDEVSAALPVVYLAGVAAPLDQLTPKLRAKIEQAMRVIGVADAQSPEEVAEAIVVYCIKKPVNPAILLAVASTYQQGRTADILRGAAQNVEEAVRFAGGEVVKNAPMEKTKPAAPTVKASRGLSKK